MGKKPVITIDGPAGAGKSTVSKALAKRLSYIYLDTGAFYRAIAYKVKKEGISIQNEEQLKKLSKNISISIINEDGRSKVLVDGEEITDKIRTEDISMLASIVSARPCVREALLHLQRKAAVRGGIVAEGRDMGTVVFPDAAYKFYLDADIEERTKRRYKEVFAKNGSGDYEKVKSDLIIRDKQDQEREIAPLKPAENAVIIDTTTMTVEDIIDKMAGIIICREKSDEV